jgi:hypothetical protein
MMCHGEDLVLLALLDPGHALTVVRACLLCYGRRLAVLVVLVVLTLTASGCGPGAAVDPDRLPTHTRDWCHRAFAFAQTHPDSMLVIRTQPACVYVLPRR